MRRCLACLGLLLSIPACGIKGPPRPPEARAKAPTKAPAVQAWGLQNSMEEKKLQFEEELR